MRACAAIAGLFAGIAAAQPPAPGVDELARLDLLPQLKRTVFTGSVSSYDRTGGNDDGFSGKYSFVRKEGDGLVLADLAGPGAIYRIWTPTPTDDPIEFYFDGEPAPRLRLKFSELFNGTRAPFTPPLAGFGGGGFYSYVPLAFAKSCKVVARAAKIQFYQINYATYAAGAEVRAFDPALPAAAYERARRVFAAPGADLTEFTTPPGATTHVVRRSVRLPAGAPVTVFAADRPGRIAGLRMGPASAFAGRDRGTVIRMFWDGDPRPAVEAPVSDLFGYSFGQPAMKGALAGTSAGVSYFYFPMPFDRSARIELEAQGTAPADPVVVEVVSSDRGRGPDEGRFYAAWRRENPTRDGVRSPSSTSKGAATSPG